MPIIATTPIEADGKQYPYYATQLIISPGIEQKSISARLVVNLTPYRVGENGDIEARQDLMKTFLSSDAFTKAQNDFSLAEALISQSELIQKFIFAKGF